MASSNLTAHKNPLTVAFGRALQRQRDEIAKTSAEVAEEIGIGAGYYRLIESGSNSLHVNKALSLVNAFDGTIELEAVIKLIGSISIMELASSKIKEGTYADGLARACADLSNYDEKLRSLLDGFATGKLFDRMKEEAPEAVERAVVEMGLDRHVLEFLTSYKKFGVPPDVAESEYLQHFFDTVPSFYVGLLDSMRDYLDKLPNEFNLFDLNIWVDSRMDKLSNMYVLVKKHLYVTHWNNIKSYRFEYLKYVDEAKFVFLEENLSPNELKLQFATNLKKSYKATRDTPNDLDHRLNKLQFAVAKHRDELAEDILKASIPRGDFEFDSAWLLSFRNGNNAGFLAFEKPDPSTPEFGVFDRASNLTHKETNIRIEKFRSLWINAQKEI